MPVHIQNTELVDDLVSLEHLDGDNSGVLKLVVRDLAVEDLKSTVVTGVSEERQAALVILDLTNRLAVEPHGLVRANGEIEIVPQETLVIRTNDQVITTGVNIERRDPTRSVGLAICPNAYY